MRCTAQVIVIIEIPMMTDSNCIYGGDANCYVANLKLKY